MSGMTGGDAGGSIYNYGVTTQPAAGDRWSVSHQGHRLGSFAERADAERFAWDVRFGNAFFSDLFPADAPRLALR